MSDLDAADILEHHSVPVRSAKQIVDQTEELAAELARTFYGREVAVDGFKFHLSADPRAQVCWRAACEAQQRLTNTDPEDALSELDENGPASVVEMVFSGDDEPVGFLVIQEGGSSDELYSKTFTTESDALDFRQSAAQASYPTSDPIAVPLALLDHPRFSEIAERIAAAAGDVDYPADEQDAAPSARPRP
ncbi:MULTISPECIES: hypothetical protein [Achromobacter]|uniref:hypothetical protein n=1 Tax=Achromobacter TaxID=222 RepID=UPI0023F93C17|nr:hypothetical protein [Achromobacter anxifer]MDF8362048.1 hypothetical protein [Achromobacter anxifer]